MHHVANNDILLAKQCEKQLMNINNVFLSSNILAISKFFRNASIFGFKDWGSSFGFCPFSSCEQATLYTCIMMFL